MTQAEVDAWLASHGGATLQHGTVQKDVKNPAYNPDKPGGAPQYTTVEVETWVNSKTGAKLEAQHLPDGNWERHDAVDADPNKPGTTGPQQTPDQARATAAQAAKGEQDAATEQALNNERSWNSQHGYGWVTHAQRDTAIRQEETQARADRSQDRITAAQEASNQLARDRFQFDKDKANQPDVATKDTPVNGVHYVQVTRTPKDGSKPTVTYLGPDGKEVARLPSEGEATAGGPPMPVLVAGATGQAARQYLEQINNDTSLTTARREALWQQFKDAARIVNDEAVVVQRDRESQRNTAYNVATNRLTHMQTGTQNALEFVTKLNGLLPEGSTQGGDAFAALMSLNMLQMHLSGMDNLGAGAPAVPTIAPGVFTSGDKNAVTAARQQVTSQVAQVAVPATTPPNAIGAGGVGNTVAPGAPARPAVPGAPAPYAPGPLDNLPPPPVASTAAPPLGQGQDASTPAGIPEVYPDMSVQYQPPAAIPQLGQGEDISTPVQPAQPINADPSQGPVGVTPPPQFSALEAFTPQLPPMPMTPNPAAAAAAPEMDALRLARIDGTPPWQLSEDDITWAEQNGHGDRAWAIPGRRRSVA